MLDPGNFLLTLALAGLVMQWLQDWPRLRSLGRGLILVAIAGFAAIAVLPLGGWLVASLENRFPAVTNVPDRVDGIIVLGGATQASITHARGQDSLNNNVERLTAFVTLAHKYPDARLVFSGGSSSLNGSVLSEADIAQSLFNDLGLDTSRVHFERKARNTWENARGILATLKPKSGDAWLLVTSARHMPRAMGVFRATGWPVKAWPVDYRTGGMPGLSLRFDLKSGLASVSEGIREWTALAIYRLLDRTGSFFPAP